MRVSVTLPLPPNRANARGHWSKHHAERMDYMTRAMVMHPKRLREPMPHARISATLYVWNKLDKDNLMARMKWPVDWLVSRGFIPDDSEKYLDWAMPKQVIDRKNQRVEITLDEERRVNIYNRLADEGRRWDDGPRTKAEAYDG